jgi:hypothetical protein
MKTAKQTEADRPSIKVQTELEGELKAGLLELETTNIPRTELLRQALVRLITEFRQTGELTIKTLSKAA